MSLKWKQIITKLVILAVMPFAYATSQLANGATGEAHVHGISEMTVAMENNVLAVQLQSPAVNLLGFEHEARTQKEIASVEKAVKKLKQPKSFFSIKGGQCKLLNQSIDVASVLMAVESEQHAHHDEHVYEDEHHSPHSEVTANYEYRCNRMRDLSSMTVSLFKTFPSIHQIQVRWVKETQQGAATLSARNQEITFR